MTASSPAMSFDESEDALLKRICLAYQRTVESATDQASEFQPTLWWQEIRSRHLSPVQNALLSSDISALRWMYRNFFFDACGKGLVQHPPNRTNSGASFDLNEDDFRFIHEDAWHRIGYWRTMTEQRYPLTALQASSVGNPFGTTLEGVFVPVGSEYHHACADRIMTLTGEHATIVEIGGGYGHMAYYLLRDAQTIRYLDFDVPESLALAAYYLGRSLPEKRMLLYGEESLSIETIGNWDILLMPPWEMNKLTRGCAHLTFSSHVFPDMAPQTREAYLQQVACFTSGYVVDIGDDPSQAAGEALEEVFSRLFGAVEKRRLYWSMYRAPGASEWERVYRTANATDHSSHALRSLPIRSCK